MGPDADERVGQARARILVKFPGASGRASRFATAPQRCSIPASQSLRAPGVPRGCAARPPLAHIGWARERGAIPETRTPRHCKHRWRWFPDPRVDCRRVAGASLPFPWLVGGQRRRQADPRSWALCPDPPGRRSTRPRGARPRRAPRPRHDSREVAPGRRTCGRPRWQRASRAWRPSTLPRAAGPGRGARARARSGASSARRTGSSPPPARRGARGGRSRRVPAPS